MLSIVILTKNEEKNIAQCLDSLKWADDIHIIDSHSTDHTVDIAQSKGVHIHFRDFDTHAQQHNWAHTHLPLKYKWVLHLDADERSTPSFEKALKYAIENASATTQGFYCCWKLMMGNHWLKHTDCFPRWQLRLIRQEIIPYIDFGHAQKEQHFADGSLSYIQEPYLHYPFKRGWEHWIHRHNIYSSKEAQERLNYPFTWQDLISQHASKRVFFLKIAVSKIGLLWPFIRFLYSYILRLGFLDGLAGLQYLISIAFYEWCIYLKMTEENTE